MRYLLTVTEVYRVNSEEEALQMIEDARNDNQYILSKYNSQYKERKQKGEVVDSYWKVSLTKEFTNEKEPELQTTIEYSNELGSAF